MQFESLKKTPNIYITVHVYVCYVSFDFLLFLFSQLKQKSQSYLLVSDGVETRRLDLVCMGVQTHVA